MLWNLYWRGSAPMRQRIWRNIHDDLARFARSLDVPASRGYWRGTRRCSRSGVAEPGWGGMSRSAAAGSSAPSHPLTRARNPSRQLAYRGSKLRSCLAFLFEDPRALVICSTTNSPPSGRPSQAGRPPVSATARQVHVALPLADRPRPRRVRMRRPPRSAAGTSMAAVRRVVAGEIIISLDVYKP